jgi:hypothetical protein
MASRSKKHRPAERRSLRLRLTDQETARDVAVENRKTGEVVGAGCLLSNAAVLTCRHVVEYALEKKRVKKKTLVQVNLLGLTEPLVTFARVVKTINHPGHANDLALLRLPRKVERRLDIPSVEFATPLRHGGKTFSAFGFPDSDKQGRNTTGRLHAADAAGLVQMDSEGALLVQQGFSGAPVWSSDVNGFVGLIVTELQDRKVAWCIPSRVLAKFVPSLTVRFRMPTADRPQVNDYGEDDPNVQLFGTVSNDGWRKLSAKVVRDSEAESGFTAYVKYRCLKGSPRPKGRLVTFITHPSFTSEYEDAYELFSALNAKGVANAEFYPAESFTVAAIGDAGETALTLDLAEIRKKPDEFE